MEGTWLAARLVRLPIEGGGLRWPAPSSRPRWAQGRRSREAEKTLRVGSHLLRPAPSLYDLSFLCAY